MCTLMEFKNTSTRCAVIFPFQWILLQVATTRTSGIIDDFIDPRTKFYSAFSP